MDRDVILLARLLGFSCAVLCSVGFYIAGNASWQALSVAPLEYPIPPTDVIKDIITGAFLALCGGLAAWSSFGAGPRNAALRLLPAICLLTFLITFLCLFAVLPITVFYEGPRWLPYTLLGGPTLATVGVALVWWGLNAARRAGCSRGQH